MLETLPEQWVLATTGYRHLTNLLLQTLASDSQPIEHPLRASCHLVLIMRFRQSAPDSESGALFERLLSASPQRRPNQPGAAPQDQGRVSIASYSRNVTYGPRCVLDARTNSEWIPLGRTAGRMGAATNQAAEEGYRLVRNGRISARNSAPGVGTSPQGAKKASRKLFSRLALQCRGDWIRTSDLLNPIQEAWRAKCRKNAALSRLSTF